MSTKDGECGVAVNRFDLEVTSERRPSLPGGSDSCESELIAAGLSAASESTRRVIAMPSSTNHLGDAYPRGRLLSQVPTALRLCRVRTTGCCAAGNRREDVARWSATTTRCQVVRDHCRDGKRGGAVPAIRVRSAPPLLRRFHVKLRPSSGWGGVDERS